MAEKKKEKRTKLTEAEKRERVALALAKKKEVENRAMEIVHRLVDSTAEPKWLVEVANLLNQAYYDDIVTERSIVRICGYPLCALPLTPQHQRRHAAQYHISLDQKKVFDLTERRKFCSNFCFKASNYYRQQLETAPLWLREQQQHGTPVQLLQLSVGEKQQQAKKSCQQLSGKGQLVDIGLPSLEPVVPNSEDKERNETEGQSDKKEEMAGDNDVAKVTVGVFDKKPPGEVAPMAMAAKTGEVGEKSVVEGDASTREHLLQTKFRAPPHREPIEPPSVVVMRTLKLWFTQRSFRFLFRTQADELDGEEEASLRNGREIPIRRSF